MSLIRYLYRLYWVRLLGSLYDMVKPIFGEAVEYEWLEPGFKGVVTVIALLLIREVYLRIRHAYTRYRLRKSMDGHTVREPHTAKDTSFIEEIDAAQYPVHTLGRLKAEKEYGKLGDIHRKLNQPAEAAHWYKKDKQYDRAAAELARAGKTVQAARLLKRNGDYETAARFFAAAGKHKRAAALLKKQGDLAGAATTYVEAGYYDKAAALFMDYFQQTTDPPERQLAAAERCYQHLQQGAFAKSLPTPLRNALLNLLAQQFRAAGRTALAARVFQQAGDTRHASEMYKRTLPKQEPRKGPPKQP